MKKQTLLEQVSCGDGSTMALYEHDGDYVIRVDGAELMSTRRTVSEYRLGEVACLDLARRPKVRVLIGGLGLGFTLRAALATLGKDAQVVVAELMPEVVAWNRNPAYTKLAKAELEDPRTVLEMGDVFDIIARAKGTYDAIMLDADNSTTKMNTEGNAELFRLGGIAKVRNALKPGGCAVYWTARPEPKLSKLLQQSGFTVTEEKMRAAGTTGAVHGLHIGKLPPKK